MVAIRQLRPPFNQCIDALMQAGVFIPTIMVGACWGGLFGLGLHKLLHALSGGTLGIQPAPYALVGAVAVRIFCTISHR
eukprot:COSAG05_NODE_16717_length_340_cov_0.846473_1_plen_79_part_00